MVYKLKYLSAPIAFFVGAKLLDRYYIKNDLRFLYFEIVQPTYRRYDDSLAPDFRDFEADFEINIKDKSKSMVDQLEAKLKSRKDKLHGTSSSQEQKEINVREVKENSNFYGGSGRTFDHSIE